MPLIAAQQSAWVLCVATTARVSAELDEDDGAGVVDELVGDVLDGDGVLDEVAVEEAPAPLGVDVILPAHAAVAPV